MAPISKKYLCRFYYSISQKAITLSGRRFITVSGVFITLSGSYYIIGRFYYIIGHVLQYRAFITLSVGTGEFTRAICGAHVLAVSLTAVDARQIDNVFTRPSLSQRSLAPVIGRPQVT